MVAQLTGELTAVSKFRNFPKNQKATTDYINAPSISKNNQASYTTSKDVFTIIINDYISDVFATQKTDSELAAFVEVNGITPAFTVLGDQITFIKNDILGGKEKDNSLLKSL